MHRFVTPFHPFALAACLAFTLLAAPVAHAVCTTTSPCMPPPGCIYLGPNIVPYVTTPMMVRNLNLHSPTSCTPPPPPGGTIDSFFDIFYEMEISSNGGGSWSPATGTAHGVIRMTTQSGTGIIDTEMLALDLLGLPGIRIRECPSRPSIGQTTITPAGGGQYHIDSFFDVFTELSLDDGQTWRDGTQAHRESLTSDPATPVKSMTTWGALKMIYR